jgi:hypothetical protein
MDILKHLKAARDKTAFELGRMEAAISALSGSGSKSIKPTGKRPRRKKMTAKARAAIRRAQKARWKAWRAKHTKK